MTFSLVSSAVNADPSVTTYNINTSAPKNETAAQAVNIGNLDEESATVSVSDQGAAATNAVSTTFTALQGTTSLSQDFENIVNEATTQFQLFDSQSSVAIADSQGTDAQQAAYAEWVAGTLQLSPGQYTATATPDLGGTPLTISSQEQQGTSLSVNSSLTGGDATEFYNFSFSGANMLMNFDAGSSNATRVQILDSNGNVVADSAGDAFQQANYQALTSGTGLAASSGDYTVEVSYANGADPTQTVPYNFQLYAGNSYAVIYQNNVTAQPYDNSASGSVTATSDAQLYSANQFNHINGSAATAVNIGWLQENKSSLDVYSQLTGADSTDYYSLTLQQGNNLKFGFNTTTTTDPSALRVQILNSTGTQVIADSEGTAAQQAAYQALTTANGLTTNPGTYVVKVSYAKGAQKTTTPYEFGIYSGTSYSAEYKTTASAQTYANAIASGELTSSASASSAIASYLTAQSQGSTVNPLTTALQTLI